MGTQMRRETDGPWALMSLVVLVALLLLSGLAVLWGRRRKWRGPPPPGPPALPLIGHFHLLLGAAHPAQALATLSRRYGPLMSLRLGSIPFVVASTPDAARQILQTHDQAFAFRAPLATVTALIGNNPGISFARLGPNLTFFRQLCATHLFNSSKLQRFRPIRDEEVKMLLQAIFADADGCAENQLKQGAKSDVAVWRAVVLRPHLQTAANNIISRMLVRDKTHLLRPLIFEMNESLSAVNLGEFFPWIQWADLQGCVKRASKVGIELKAALQGIIDARRQQRAGRYDPPEDLLDILLSASLSCPPEVQLTDAHIRSILMDIFGGGSETSGIVIEWAMAELLANPAKLKVAEDEIHSVLSRKKRDKGQCSLEEEDIQGMPYLRAIVKETMRLHPVLPLLIPREAQKQCNICGYDIATGTQAFVNTWAIGRDPTVWDKPLDFVPERFLESGIDVRGQHFELLPFGSGRRICPGRNLGLLSIQLILCHLLYAFSWKPHDLEHDMSPNVGFLTVKARPLLAFANPKLPREYYLE